MRVHCSDGFNSPRGLIQYPKIWKRRKNPIWLVGFGCLASGLFLSQVELYWGHKTSQYLWHGWATWIKFTHPHHDREMKEQFVDFVSVSESAGWILRGSLSQSTLTLLSPFESAKNELWALEATIQFDQFDLRASGCQQQCWLKLSLFTVLWSVVQVFFLQWLKFRFGNEVLIWGQ